MYTYRIGIMAHYYNMSIYYIVYTIHTHTYIYIMSYVIINVSYIYIALDFKL